MGVLTTKPTTLARGTSSSVVYSRTSLKALINDAYFGDDTNWKKVVFYYKDASGTQKTYVSMNSLNTGVLRVSSKAYANTWQLQKILITDFDGGTYVIKRASLDSSDDVAISS